MGEAQNKQLQALLQWLLQVELPPRVREPKTWHVEVLGPPRQRAPRPLRKPKPYSGKPEKPGPGPGRPRLPRPPRVELIALARTHRWYRLSFRYGVSVTTVRNWVRPEDHKLIAERRKKKRPARKRA